MVMHYRLLQFLGLRRHVLCSPDQRPDAALGEVLGCKVMRIRANRFYEGFQRQNLDRLPQDCRSNIGAFVKVPSENSHMSDEAGMSDTAHIAWNAERQRLQLVVSCAVRQLMSHMGSEDLYMPHEGEILRITKLNQGGFREAWVF